MNEEDKYPKLKNENDEYPSSVVDDNFWDLLKDDYAFKEWRDNEAGPTGINDAINILIDTFDEAQRDAFVEGFKKGLKEASPKKAPDKQRVLNNIKTHIDMLADPRMRRHAYIDKSIHPIDFQVFRVLTGYNEALEELEKQKELITTIKLTLEKHQTWTGQGWKQNHIADFEAAKILDKIEEMEK